MPSSDRNRIVVLAVIQVLAGIKTAIVARPNREVVGLATATEDSETEDEHNDLRATIHRRGDDVVVLDEELGMLLAEVPLGNEADEEVDTAGRVHADAEVSDVPEDDASVHVVESLLRVESVKHIKRQRGEEAEQICDRNPLVSASNGEHLLGHAPRDSHGVVLLHVLARPDVATLR